MIKYLVVAAAGLLVALPVVVLVVELAVVRRLGVLVVVLALLVKCEEMEGLEMRGDHEKMQPQDSVFPRKIVVSNKNFSVIYTISMLN